MPLRHFAPQKKGIPLIYAGPVGIPGRHWMRIYAHICTFDAHVHAHICAWGDCANMRKYVPFMAQSNMPILCAAHAQICALKKNAYMRIYAHLLAHICAFFVLRKYAQVRSHDASYSRATR
jgi:hypothetical protein